MLKLLADAHLPSFEAVSLKRLCQVKASIEGSSLTSCGHFTVVYGRGLGMRVNTPQRVDSHSATGVAGLLIA